MTNNDIFRQLRYILDYNDDEMIEVFKEAEIIVSREQICNWLKKEEDEQEYLPNSLLNYFLDGLINKKRGKRKDYTAKEERELTNNSIVRKLKIAFNFKDYDLIEIFQRSGTTIGKHELSAFFRNPKQSQYRDMGNQYLRNFLHGLQLTLRPSPENN